MKAISRSFPKLLLFCGCWFLLASSFDVAYGQRNDRRAITNDSLSKTTQAFLNLIIYHRDECYWANRKDIPRANDTYRMKWKPYGNVTVHFQEGRFTSAYLRVPLTHKNQVMMDAAKSMLGGRIEIGRTSDGSPSWHLDSNFTTIFGVRILSDDELLIPYESSDDSSTVFAIVQIPSAYVE